MRNNIQRRYTSETFNFSGGATFLAYVFLAFTLFATVAFVLVYNRQGPSSYDFGVYAAILLFGTISLEFWLWSLNTRLDFRHNYIRVRKTSRLLRQILLSTALVGLFCSVFHVISDGYSSALFFAQASMIVFAIFCLRPSKIICFSVQEIESIELTVYDTSQLLLIIELKKSGFVEIYGPIVPPRERTRFIEFLKSTSNEFDIQLREYSAIVGPSSDSKIDWIIPQGE